MLTKIRALCRQGNKRKERKTAKKQPVSLFAVLRFFVEGRVSCHTKGDKIKVFASDIPGDEYILYTNYTVKRRKLEGLPA
jgi:hypothetical protein